MIRRLGMEAGQARIDLAFALARIEACLASLHTLMDLSASLTEQNDARDDGLMLIPAQALGTLSALLR